MKKITVIFCSLCLWLVGGCATYQPSIPKNYTGPRAILRDSVMIHSRSKADFFHVSHVDGREVVNSRIQTRSANEGRGMILDPVVLQREIPAQPTRLTIVGRTEYAAPILALTSAVYEVKGEVEFTPEPNKAYTVRGELGKSYSAVWVEEDISKVVVGKKVEVKGSAALGFFEK
jgi:hypothetical protein